MEGYLRRFINGQPKFLVFVASMGGGLLQYVHSLSTLCSPFKALYREDPPPLLHFEKGSKAVSTLEDQLLEGDAILDDLKFNLLKAQNNMKLYEDGMHRDVHYNVGEMVYLKLHLYGEKSLAQEAL